MKTELPTLTIPNGETVSDILGFTHLRFINSLNIKGPATLPETVTIEVAHVRNPDAADFGPLQSDGSDITITADDSIPITKVAFMALRLVAGAAVAADRVFAISGDDQN